MNLTGLHLLLTYSCNLECDHCFVWGSPSQRGTMTLWKVRRILQQAKEMGTVESIYFEGGEPFLYYAVLLHAVREAAREGFRAGIVSNGYWATSAEDAVEWLKPFTGLVHDLSISTDLYHSREALSKEARNARTAANQLGIPVGFLSIAQPSAGAARARGQLPPGESAVMYRGRAAERLVAVADPAPWEGFDACPNEDLRQPGRVHVDPFGNVHICQGISLGNLFRTPLKAICAGYDPTTHPVTGPLLDGGPAELARRHQVPCRDRYADACHLCDATRRALRSRYPETLTPDQMYGVMNGR